MFENPRGGRQARNFTTIVISNRFPNRYFPKIDLGCPWLVLIQSCFGRSPLSWCFITWDFTHEHKYFSLSQLHWSLVWYYARIITGLHILNLLFLPVEAITQYTYSSPSSSRNKMQQNHVRSNKTCTVWQASFQIKTGLHYTRSPSNGASISIDFLTQPFPE